MLSRSFASFIFHFHPSPPSALKRSIEHTGAGRLSSQQQKELKTNLQRINKKHKETEDFVGMDGGEGWLLYKFGF